MTSTPFVFPLQLPPFASWLHKLVLRTFPEMHYLNRYKYITLPTKVHLVKAMVFPVIMYGCESWTVKKLSTEELMLLICGVGEDS